MSHPVDIHVGHKLKKLRKLRRLSQEDLGRALGLSFQQIQKYESGANRISASRLFELGQFMDVTPDYFFEGIHESDGPAKKESSDAALATALSRIKDDKTKERILNFIEDVSGAKLATRE